MRFLALAAAASMSLSPMLAAAQGCPDNSVLSNGVCICADGFVLGPAGTCISTAAPDVIVAIEQGQLAGLPVLTTIPPGAIILGGLVILAGVVIGIAAASNGDTTGSTTSTPTTN